MYNIKPFNIDNAWEIKKENISLMDKGITFETKSSTWKESRSESERRRKQQKIATVSVEIAVPAILTDTVVKSSQIPKKKRFNKMRWDRYEFKW